MKLSDNSWLSVWRPSTNPHGKSVCPREGFMSLDRFQAIDEGSRQARLLAHDARKHWLARWTLGFDGLCHDHFALRGPHSRKMVCSIRALKAAGAIFSVRQTGSIALVFSSPHALANADCTSSAFGASGNDKNASGQAPP
jgi:hypothetical protein